MVSILTIPSLEEQPGGLPQGPFPVVREQALTFQEKDMGQGRTHVQIIHRQWMNLLPVTPKPLLFPLDHATIHAAYLLGCL